MAEQGQSLYALPFTSPQWPGSVLQLFLCPRSLHRCPKIQSQKDPRSWGQAPGRTHPSHRCTAGPRTRSRARETQRPLRPDTGAGRRPGSSGTRRGWGSRGTRRSRALAGASPAARRLCRLRGVPGNPLQPPQGVPGTHIPIAIPMPMPVPMAVPVPWPIWTLGAARGVPRAVQAAWAVRGVPALREGIWGEAPPVEPSELSGEGLPHGSVWGGGVGCPCPLPPGA